MAKAYNLPVATLAMPEPLPPLPDLKDFRTIEGRPATLTNETAVVIDQVRTHVEFLSELREEAPDLLRTPRLPKITFDKNELPNLAKNERNRLGVTVEEQLEWHGYLDAFRHMRRHVEKMGVFVHLLKMNKDDCRGFSILQNGEGPLIPLIVVNDREETYQAKTFTLLHEYAHLLLRSTGICDENRTNQKERFCNLFAAYFLMPRELLVRVIEIQSGQFPREWGYKEISDAAKRMRVSQESLVIHLEDLGLAPEGFYRKWKGGLPEFIPGPPGGIATYAERRVRSWGVEYTGVVMKALDKAKINRIDAYEMLDLRPSHFHEVRQLLQKFA
jgi:Zn-dependent peptidase ImmA (M78 family)